MFPAHDDILRLAPEIVLCVTGMVLMLIEPFLTSARKGVLATVAALGAALALAATAYPATRQGTAFSGLLRIDTYSVFVHVIVGIVVLLVIDWLGRLPGPGEHSAGRILRAAALRHRRHGSDGQRRGVDDRVRGPRNKFDFDVHSRGIPPRYAPL